MRNFILESKQLCGIRQIPDCTLVEDARLSLSHIVNLNPLCANLTKGSNTLKQFVGNLATNCLSKFDHFVKLALERLKQIVNGLFRNQDNS